jgi:hypothetical protein
MPVYETNALLKISICSWNLTGIKAQVLGFGTAYMTDPYFFNFFKEQMIVVHSLILWKKKL